MTPACCQGVDVLLMSNCVAKNWSNLEFMEGLIWKRKLFKQRCWLANGLSPSFKLFQHVSGELAECTLLLKPQSPQRPGAKLPKFSGSDSQWALRVWGRFGSQQRPGQKGAGGGPCSPSGHWRTPSGLLASGLLELLQPLCRCYSLLFLSAWMIDLSPLWPFPLVTGLSWLTCCWTWPARPLWL